MNPMIGSILNLMGPDIMVILLILPLLFGAKKLPKLARGMDRAAKEFSADRDEIERGLGQSGGGGIARPSLLDITTELPPSAAVLAGEHLPQLRRRLAKERTR
jgi:TatA/E family protein of Tat protein translocase